MAWRAADALEGATVRYSPPSRRTGAGQEGTRAARARTTKLGATAADGGGPVGADDATVASERCGLGHAPGRRAPTGQGPAAALGLNGSAHNIAPYRGRGGGADGARHAGGRDGGQAARRSSAGRRAASLRPQAVPNAYADSVFSRIGGAGGAREPLGRRPWADSSPAGSRHPDGAAAGSPPQPRKLAHLRSPRAERGGAVTGRPEELGIAVRSSPLSRAPPPGRADRPPSRGTGRAGASDGAMRGPQRRDPAPRGRGGGSAQPPAEEGQGGDTGWRSLAGVGELGASGGAESTAEVTQMRPLPLIREVLRKRAALRRDPAHAGRVQQRAGGAGDTWEEGSQGSDMSSLVGEVEAALLSLPPSPTAGPSISGPWLDQGHVGVQAAHAGLWVRSDSAASDLPPPSSPQTRSRRGSLTLGVDAEEGKGEGEVAALSPGAVTLPGEVLGASASGSPARGRGAATALVLSAAEAWVDEGGPGAGVDRFRRSPRRERRGYAELAAAVTAAAEAGPGDTAPVSTTLGVELHGRWAPVDAGSSSSAVYHSPGRTAQPPATVMDWAASGALGGEQRREVEWGRATAQRVVRGRGGRAAAEAARESRDAEAAAATSLQAAWRGEAGRREAAAAGQEREAREWAAAAVQRRARSAAAQRGAAREEAEQEASEGAATTLQRRARGMAARRAGQWGVAGSGTEEEGEAVEHAVAREAAALKIQRTMRGRWARRVVATLRSLQAMTGGLTDSGSEWSSGSAETESTAWASGDEFTSAFVAANAFMQSGGGGGGDTEWV